MNKYIRIELVDNEQSLYSMCEDRRLGTINESNIIEVEENHNLPSGVSIGPKMVENFIVGKQVLTLGTKTTVVKVRLANGFEIVESSSCVDEVNYNEEIGVEICMERIKNKVWELLGFLLQTASNGIK